MGGFDRKLKRQAARSVMKENNIPKHLISEKVKQYTKMDNSATLENEKKSINYMCDVTVCCRFDGAEQDYSFGCRYR